MNHILLKLLIAQYEAELKKEREDRKLAQQLVKELTLQISKKNKEIESQKFFLEAASLSLSLSSQALDSLKK
ncbi:MULTISPECIES: hypothetical protein [Cytobacillus]|uniref:hypothetical protein n=1 Tax=Cytobacillus TaxID=2675230 RepID=UPI0025A2EC72|nr:hypothetical protein [Cytobacillus kochii]MDM5208437.1 hypothetical protein [Cytobacillus kochii]